MITEPKTPEDVLNNFKTSDCPGGKHHCWCMICFSGGDINIDGLVKCYANYMRENWGKLNDNT